MADGQPFPLGVSWLPSEQAYNFAIYSQHANRVELILFRDDACVEPTVVVQFDPLRNKTGPIWHCHLTVASAMDARFYGYRIDGPNIVTHDGFHAFDSKKILLDPYARTVCFRSEGDLSITTAHDSNSTITPLALLDECQCSFKWNSVDHIRHEADLIIYEMHVRGFTRNPNSGVSPQHRGTFQGVIDKIPYLSELGVTAVELMPVFQFDPKEGNYWGYMPLNFFSPHHAYSTSSDHCTQRSEFRRMVQALHGANIEVILDVVFNHTCEGNETGPTYSFKGIDNASYYLAAINPAEKYANLAGCGNTLNTSHPIVRRLIIDSLRYWVTEMHVDGFRFDLASIFARNSDGTLNLNDPPIFSEITYDPALRDVRLIAEPWDASEAFLLGKKFPGTSWMQWNAHYRDTLQQFVRGDSGLIGSLMTRIYGSCDLFPDDSYHSLRPWQSINYITSHDGFSLYDLVSYDHKHNEANGHCNRDGADDYSHNCGFEGDIDLPSDVLRLRKQKIKTFFCLLMLSNGTPMFRMGDEFMQTQGGNNNPYNHDNETSWLDWSRLRVHADVFRFFRAMIAFRKAHPSLSRSRFWRDDIAWFGVDGPVDLSSKSKTLAYFLSGKSESDHDFYVFVNASSEPVSCRIRRAASNRWLKAIDTAADSPNDIIECGLPEGFFSVPLTVSPNSVVVLIDAQ
ncbi:MAG: isoamylase [Pirellulaceae bacterium]|nr:isoamylase [Pirellulaceae bacterium]